MNLKNKFIKNIGWVASGMAIIMFSSYIDQIRLNLNGKAGSIVLPIATILNCIFWLLYAIFREKKDLPLIICNTVGILVGTVTLITAVI
jgi:uncharacterized protein with PQ loop repeat